MSNLSQNKKIAISAVALFIVSFSTMLFFLGSEGMNPEHGGANVIEAENAGKHAEEVTDGGVTFVTDVEGVIKEADPGFCELIRKECVRLVGKKLFDYVNKEDLADLASVYGKLAQNGEKMDAIGPIRVLGGKNEKLLLLSAEPIKDKEGKVLSIRFAVKDITEKVKGLDGEVGAGEPDDSVKPEKPKTWLERLYPKIKETDGEGTKLLVKISYKRENE